MSSGQIILVVYDISNDGRRTKLHNALLDYGTPVQYSVFECLLDDNEQAKLKKAVERVIKPKVDRVRFYFICNACAKRIQVTCGVDVVSEAPPALVVGGEGDGDGG